MRMVNDHYKGIIDVVDYWQVGDMRTESITAIPSGTTGESQSSQDIQLVIIGMNHDNLADGTGNAAITLQTKNQLGIAGYIYSAYDSPSYSLWSGSPRRTWCNNDFKTSLPTWLQNLIKPVTKITNRHAYTGYETYRGQTNTTDDVFLLSEFEIFGNVSFGGSVWGDVGSDGTQYEFMETKSNRIKTGPSSYWWLRSSLVGSTGASYFNVIYSDGTNNNHSSAIPSYTYGIAPAFCL